MENRDKLLTNLNISLQRVRAFSSPEFSDVYSKTYFQKVLKNSIYNSKDSFSFIFGDFNKLGVINDLYGHDFGDNALRLAMKIIKKSIPNNSIIVRAGGDEIYILIPNSNKDFANKCCNLIHTNLQKNAILIGGLSIELAASDSTYGNIDQLIDLTDAEVTNIKASRESDISPADILSDNFLMLSKPDSISNSESKMWDILNEYINISIYEFLQNFRPSRTLAFDKNQIIDTTSFVISSFISSLNEKLDDKLPANIFNIVKEDYIAPEINVYSSHNLDKNNYDIIHNLLKKDCTIDFDDFSDKDIETLTTLSDNLLEDLIRDNTGLLSKQYFRLFLADVLSKLDIQLAASYVTTSGIKLSNFAFDHTFTDRRLEKTNDIFCNAVCEEIDFDNISFNYSVDNIYLLSQGAGNYLFLYPKEMVSELRPKIESIVNRVNNSADMQDPNSSFKLSAYSTRDEQTVSKGSVSEFINYVRKLKEEANYAKNPLKKELFQSVDTFFAFKKSINSCIDFYLENISNDPQDINKLSTFIRNIYTSFLNQEVLHNETRNEKKTTGLDVDNYSR